MASHAKSSATGLEAGAMPGMGTGTFRRMRPDLPAANRLSKDCIMAIAVAMTQKDDAGESIDHAEPVDENPTIPAGFTYFGQFVDHDLTLDPTPLSVSSGSLTNALEDFRTPALDLDCVYGRGKDDQPYMYKGVELRLGEALDHNGGPIQNDKDLHRLPDGTAILGDKRNDENKIVSQVQGAMIRLHNKIVHQDALLLRAGARLVVGPDWSQDQADDSRFRAAVAIVRWHYQWVVLNDYLDRICEPGMVSEVLNPNGAPRLLNYLHTAAEYPYMPLEFSGAAFRFAHSMVRPSYALNIDIGTDVTRVMRNGKSEPVTPRIPTFSNGKPDSNLNGFVDGTLPPNWAIDWGYFLPGLNPKVGKDFKVPQPSYRIDANLVSPLRELPEFKDVIPPVFRNLAFRNLARGQQLGLPSGETMSNAFGITPLGPNVLWTAGSSRITQAAIDAMSEDARKSFDPIDDARRDVAKTFLDHGLRGNTPLWYYILREAEYYGVTNDPNEEMVILGGQHLGPLGSRIVAETLVAIVWLDETSYLNCKPGFQPYPEISDNGPLTLDKLLAYALTP